MKVTKKNLNCESSTRDNVRYTLNLYSYSVDLYNCSIFLTFQFSFSTSAEGLLKSYVRRNGRVGVI